MHKAIDRLNAIPSGWIAFTPEVQNSFEFGTDKVAPFSDRYSGFVRSIGETDAKFGILMQTISAIELVGTYICFAGMAKIDQSETLSEMWMETNDEYGSLIQSVSFRDLDAQE